MANPEHVAVVLKGKDAIAEWRRLNPGGHLDLGQADLSGANLAGADLAGANLIQAILFAANLSGANLSGAHAPMANLVLAKLMSADGSGADFTWANFTGADLTGADLRAADLGLATLNGSELSGADLSQAKLGLTSLSDIDLSQVIGLGAVNHESPSSAGVDTLIASLRAAGDKLTSDLEAFFRGAGVPEGLLRDLPRLVAEVKYYTCFISYGQPDLAFATRLREDLLARGVSCYLYTMDKTPGERIWHEIGMKRREAEKMVVLCSAKALVRDGVLKEIEEQVDEDPDKIVPISLDDLWMEAGFKVMRGDRDLKPSLRDRNYADFAGWESDAGQYQKALSELLKGLRRQET